MRAARLAAVVAVPVALVAGLLTYRTLSGMRPAPQDSSPRPANTGPVIMAAPSLAEADAATCQRLVASLPGRTYDLRRRPVTEGVGQNAAYGDPPIKISCGDIAPPVPPDADIYPLGGICWWVDDAPDSAGFRPDPTVWRTADRSVLVTVAFPAAYRNRGESQMLLEFRDAILASVPAVPKPPSYCALPSTAPS